MDQKLTKGRCQLIVLKREIQSWNEVTCCQDVGLQGYWDLAFICELHFETLVQKVGLH